VSRQASLAHCDGLVQITDAAVLFGKLRKSNRRRIPLDPASEIVDAWVVGHAAIIGRLAVGY
jgi:hypothetical protein